MLIQPNARKGIAQPLNASELLPIPVRCDIHPWMTANMLVVDHPYAAISDSKGEFKIERVPAGRRIVRVWLESAGYVKRNFEIEVQADETTDLGEIVMR